MTAAIQTEGLCKAYRGRAVLDDVDLTVTEGEVFGFLGPNGAGKTTTIRILLGLARPTSGSVRILGQDVATGGDAVRAQLGFLPDVPGYYPWMTAPEYLRFAGSLFGLSGSTLDERIDALLDMAGLTGVTHKVGTFSRGMKQRLGVAQALVNAPRLLLLDEPTSALDPLGRKEALDMVASLRGRTTVFFSTHILSDVERVCDSVAILDEGRVVTQAAVGELKQRYGGASQVHVVVAERAAELATRIGAEPWCEKTEPHPDGGIRVAVSDRSAADRRIPALVADLAVPLLRYEPLEASLEDVFVQLVGKGARR